MTGDQNPIETTAFFPDMKAKQLAILIVAALVLGGLGWYVRSRDSVRLAESQLRMGELLLEGLDVNEVAGIRIRQGTNALNLAREGETWVVRERADFPVEFDTLAGFVRKLAELKITKPVNVGPSRLAALELVESGEGATGTRVDLLRADGQPLRSLLLGKEHLREGAGASPMGGGGFPDGRYVMVGTDAQNIALVSDPLSDADPAPEQWLRKEFFKVEKPVRVAVTYPSSEDGFSLVRTNEFGDWTLAGLAEGESLDTAKAGAFNSILGFPSFDDVVVDPDRDALGLASPTRVEVDTAAGFRYRLQVGTVQGGDKYPLEIAVTADLPTERAAGAEESAEDKERLDKEFKEQSEKLAAKLATESGLSGRVFLVSKWTLDSVLKKRSDLLSKPDAAPAAGEVPEAGEASPFGLPPGLNIPGL